MKSNFETLNGCEYLLNQLDFCKNELKISCNDGSVSINVKTLNFTYIGKFGTMVSRFIFKKDVVNDFAKKLIILHLFMDLYSKQNGGFNLIAS